MARAPCPSGTRPIASYSISSAIVKQSCVSTKREIVKPMPALCQRLLPGNAAAFEFQNVALRHRQEILHMARHETDRLVDAAARSRVGKDNRRGSVGHQRTIGALQRAGDKRIFVAFLAAELESRSLRSCA